MTVWPRAGSRSLAFVCGLLSLIAAVGIGCDSPERANGAPQQPAFTLPMLVRQGQGPELLQLHGALPNIATARAVQLPGLVENTCQISFDDRRVASILSRV